MTLNQRSLIWLCLSLLSLFPLTVRAQDSAPPQLIYSSAKGRPEQLFVVSADGNEIYFHRNSVANGGFDKLAVGDEVRFVAQSSESANGAQASTVVPIGKITCRRPKR